MPAKNIFNFIELKFKDLTEQTNTWLRNVYQKSDILFNSSSPYGQLLTFIEEVFRHNMIYQKRSVEQINIEQTIDPKVIWNIARIAGHSPTRPISSTGTLMFKLKPGININEEISSGIFTINNYTVIKNKTNNLKYSIMLGTDANVYNMNESAQFFTNIIQGEFETQTFTGAAEPSQSISVNISSESLIENFNVLVFVDNYPLTIKEHKYSMLPDEYSCVVRTGFNGGVDVEFGTNDFGFVPSLGSIIEVKYLLTEGQRGDILNPISNDWTFIDTIRDSDGNSLEMEDLFNIEVDINIGLSSNGESPKFTKSLIPYVSRNFVLSTPPQFIFHLKRLNMFSKINAFNKSDDNNFGSNITSQIVDVKIQELKKSISLGKSSAYIENKMLNFENAYYEYFSNTNDNQIYLYLIPKISNYFTDSVNYFNVPIDVFYLDSVEQNKIINYIKKMGILSMTSELIIIQPKITKYVSYIYVRRFDDVTETNIKQDIISNMSKYLLNNERFDRIVKSDLIKELKSIDGIDSVDIHFISQKNENYHARNSRLIQKGLKQKNLKFSKLTKRKSIVNINTKNITPISELVITNDKVESYDNDAIIGLDPVHGDIIIGKDEYAIIRGGWKDRNNLYYNENPDSEGLTSINIIFDGVTNKENKL